MKLTAARTCALILSVWLTAATNGAAPVGFADLSQLLAAHPLHKVLDGYDREIAALRSTQSALPGDPGARARQAGAAVARDAASARLKIQQIASGSESRDRSQERAALAALSAAPSADRAMAAYRDALARETSANLRAYSNAIATRTGRALDARRQQLLEKEAAYAFALSRRDSGARFVLRLKLQDLHLDRETRGRIQAELDALTRRDAGAVAAMRHTDAALLDRYRQTVEREGAVADASMASQLRAKATANLRLRTGVLQVSSSNAVAPSVAARVAGFAASYRHNADAGQIDAGLQKAGNDLPNGFARLSDADRLSRGEVATQIRQLQERRAELYRAIVAQIERNARQLAHERRLGNVVFKGPRPEGSVDLTKALTAEGARF